MNADFFKDNRHGIEGEDWYFTPEEFQTFVDANYPHMVHIGGVSRNRIIEICFEVIEEIGPIRFAYQTYMSVPGYRLELPTTNEYYSADGTWFYIVNKFYFKDPEYAMLFKLKYQ